TSNLSQSSHIFFQSTPLHPPQSPLFPYTTLFRSSIAPGPLILLRVKSASFSTQISIDKKFITHDQITTSLLNNENSIIISDQEIDRKSTRLNSSHVSISYAVFCLKKKT